MFCEKLFEDPPSFLNHFCRPYCPDLIPVFNFEAELVQHIKSVHGRQKPLNFQLNQLNKPGVHRPPTWHSAKWICNICSVPLYGWQGRLDHISYHWKTGKTRSDWLHKKSPPSAPPLQESSSWLARGRAWFSRKTPT